MSEDSAEAIRQLRVRSMHLYPSWFKQVPEIVSRAVPGTGLMHAPIPTTDMRDYYDL